jgi:dihydrolipoamide dehydrogenase
VHPADVMREVAHARKVGLDYPPPAIHWETVSERMWNKIGQNGGLSAVSTRRTAWRCSRNRGVQGTHTMKVRWPTDRKRNRSHPIVCSGVGGRSFAPPIPGLAETGYLDSEHFFGDGFPAAPWKRLVIIGEAPLERSLRISFRPSGQKSPSWKCFPTWFRQKRKPSVRCWRTISGVLAYKS